MQELSKFTSGDFLDRLKSQKIKTATNSRQTDDLSKGGSAAAGDSVKHEVKVS